MRLGFDVDGVLANFNHSFIERVIEVSGEDKFPPRPFDIPTWHYPQVYGYSEELMDFATGPVWRSVKESETFWARLLPYPWANDTLEHLHRLRFQGHDIYFATDRAGVRAKEQTEFWLHMMGFDNPTVLISGKKALIAKALNLDIYVDDRFENADSVGTASPMTQTFLLTQPWNIGKTGSFTRVYSPDNVFQRFNL